MATAHEGRTYHNTAILLPSGQILVGGHSPISTMYAYNTTIPGGFSNAFRNPTFEIYNPPYMYWGQRPTISSVPKSFRRGGRIDVGSPDAAGVASVVLVRNTALTHLVDGDQRTVELPVVGRSAGSVSVRVPGSRSVLPPGPYMLFVNKRTATGLVPSTARQFTLR